MKEYVVTDRILLLGLDAVYREGMKRQESSILLSCARVVAKALAVDAATGPVEGYYVENEKLSEYFQLVKALQATDVDRRSEVERMPVFARILSVFSSKIYGYLTNHDGVLPTGHDCLSTALQTSAGHWETSALLKASGSAATENDDYSLVGLASRLSDAVCVTAVRETVVLYAEKALTGDDLDDLLRTPVYTWEVSEEVAENANRFIDEYNSLFDLELPAANQENAKLFFQAYLDNDLEGRCVCIGTDNQSMRTKYYHWTIDRSPDGNLTASDFWSEEVWTTEKYRESLQNHSL